MTWYNYIACFFAGVFLTNFVPHFVHGVSGDKFPTPFANPPGRGLSSPQLNVWWALLNLAAGSELVVCGKVSTAHGWSIVILFFGIAAMSMRLSFAASKKRKE
jgi:hypothetical protein